MEFIKDRRAKTVDVYSLSVMMLSFENAGLGLGSLGYSLGAIYSAIQKNVEEKVPLASCMIMFTYKSVLKQRIFVLLADIWADAKWRPGLSTKILEFAGPEKVQKLLQARGTQSIDTLDFEKLCADDPFMMRHVLLAGVAFVWNVYFKRVLLPLRLAKLETFKQKYTKNMKKHRAKPQSEKYKKAQELSEYFQYRIDLETGTADAKIGLVNYLLDIVHVPKSRPKTQEFFDKLEQVYFEVSKAVGAKWSYVQSLKNYYNIQVDDRRDDPKDSYETFWAKRIEFGQRSTVIMVLI